MSGSKRKSNGSTDFKRIKAKVGKKAQRTNDTDVSFQSASLHLGQSFQQDNNPKRSGNLQLLVSSRGKSLLQLFSTASTHPAAAARASSLKGILDIIKKYPTAALLPNLSTLIPVCVHSCVDEDRDVRNVGIDSLSSLLQQLQEKKIKPFGPLLIARILSALHSLDASIRVNGVKMVNILSKTCPSLTISFVEKLLPPFSSLLSDQRTKKSIDEILQSLILVLRVNIPRNADDNDAEVSRRNDQQPDLFYFSGGQSRNTVLRTRRSVHGLPNGIESITHLSHPQRPNSSSSYLEKAVVNKNMKQGSRENWFDTKLKTNLMSKLRDCLIESINLEHEPVMNSIKTRSLTTEFQGRTNFPRVLLLLRSIRYLSRSFGIHNDGIMDDDKIEFDKVARQIVSVLIDIFPLDQDPSTISSTEDTKSTSIDDINAAIAISILDVSQQTDIDNGTVENNSRKSWMKNICSHVIPRIGNLKINGSVTTSSSDLDMTCKFLRRLGMEPHFSNDLDAVLSIVHDLFFTYKNAQVARSIAGRRISMIIMELIRSSDYSLADESKAPISKVFPQFVMVIPFFLEAWASEFLYESRKLLEGLHWLIRGVEGKGDNTLVESIRDDWCKLVANRGDSASIFERYPWNLQKIYLGLMVLLEKPSDQSLKYLALICCSSTSKGGKFVRNEAISRAIVEAIKKIRKSIPMQRYLTFLFESIGISRHANEALRFESISAERDLDSSSKSVFEVAFFTADSHLIRVARALVEPGSMRVLRMILPQLSSWQQTKVGEGASTTEFLLKMRASHIILAYFFLQQKSKQDNKRDDQPSVSVLTVGGITVDTLTHSLCTFIRCVACNKDAMNFHIPLTSPIVGILSSQDSVFNELMSKVSDLLHEPGLSKVEQKNLRSIIIDWTKDPRLEDSMTVLSSPSKKTIAQLLTNSSDAPTVK